MRLLNAFKKESNKTAYVYSKSKSVSQSTGYTTESENYRGKIKGFLFIGAAAERIVSERLKPIIDAVLIVDPIKIPFNIDHTDKMIIDSEIYSLINNDDIANQGEVSQIALKKDT